MTVSMQVSKRIYAGNGVTRQWEVDFPLASPQDVRVYITSEAGAETELSADFELNAAGTELVYPTLASGKPPLAEGWTLTLERQTPLTQEIDLIRQGEVDAEVLESGYDKLTLMVQELNEKVSRSIKYPVSTSVEDLETDSFLKNILAIKQDSLNASAAAVSAAQTAEVCATNAQQTAQSALADIASSKAAAQEEIAASGLLLENSLQTYLASAQEEAATARYYAQRSIGKMVGEVYFSQSAAEADNAGALPLFTGETIAAFGSVYPDFHAWLLSHTELTCTLAQYEDSLTAYGECAKYGMGTDGSVRLPLIKNYIKAANTTDGVQNIEAGLPNITGTFKEREVSPQTSGAFESYGTDTYAGRTQPSGCLGYNFDASRSSAVYGKSDTVTPASTTLYPWVVAFNAAVPASVAQAGQFHQALSGKADTNLANVAGNIDYVVESWFENNNWYRKYKSGWLEQGGIYRSPTANPQTVNLFKPFVNNGYTLLTTSIRDGGGGLSARNNIAATGNTATSFRIFGSAGAEAAALVDFYWEAKGWGA